jgi:hypothetical protein
MITVNVGFSIYSAELLPGLPLSGRGLDREE